MRRASFMASGATMGGHRSLPQWRPELAEPRSRTPQTRLRLSNAPVWTCGKHRYLTEWVVRRSRGKKAHAMARWRRPPCHGTGGTSPWYRSVASRYLTGRNACPCCSLEQFGLPKADGALARCSPRRHPLTHPAGVWPCNSPTEIAGSAGRIRTYDQPVNSRLLYR